MSYTQKIEVSNKSKPGSQGFQGWSPVLVTETYMNSIVLKVIDWVGGFGTKPAINQYLTNTGYSVYVALATNIRGSGAIEPGDNVFVTGNFTAKNHSCYFIPPGATTFQMLLPAITQAQGFDCRIIIQGANLLTLALSGSQTVYKATSRSFSAITDVTFAVGAAPGTSYTFPKGIFEVRAFFDGTNVSVYIF
jgi:hypothetical protein